MIYFVIAVTIVYIIYMTYKKGEPLSSISEISYVAKHHWEFMAYMLFLAVYVLPVMYKKSSPCTRFLTYFTALGMLMAIITPVFRTHGAIFHDVGGVITCVACQTCILLNRPIFLLAWFPYIFFFLFMRKENHSHPVFWAEMTVLENMFMYSLI
ncbi:MAG: hypothetical protein LKI18_02885 [Prevotella sp.]|jgi:hypothetical protein|nr:hypothetical protein [Prevotella sp.]